MNSDLKSWRFFTVRKHTSIVDLFIDFICKQTDAKCIEEITKGMVNTHFKKWWKT